MDLAFLHCQRFSYVIYMKRLALIIVLSVPLSGCIVATAVGVATDIAVGTVNVATGVVGAAVDVVLPEKKKK